MKLREVIYLLGYKPKPRTYGYETRTTDLGPHGIVRYARWMHPKSRDYHVTQAEVEACQQYIRPGDFCIDIGAHIGDSSLAVGIAAGVEGCVLALEPNRYVFPTLEATAELCSDKANIHPVMAAAMQEPGTYHFSYSDPGYCNGGDSQGQTPLRRSWMPKLDVEGINLNDLLHQKYSDRLDRLRYVKTDTEGNDLSVLQSIAGLIEKHRPLINCEVFKYSPTENRKALYQFLVDRGYEVRMTGGVSIFEGEPTSLDDVCRTVHCDLIAIPAEKAAAAA